MTIEQCYELLGGSYAAVLQRLMKKERVEKFLLRIPSDPSFEQLQSSFEAKDWQNAFMAAHTLKGISANMGLGDLHEAADKLTESLRHGVSESSALYYQQTDAAWQKVLQVTDLYKRENSL
ncbi:MAG: Hpt domain-containing protein [Erysipelotrichaceae bacterium]|nr:Hpt domain-containing protein [Erysipelotrichaceae bacterium]